MAGVVSMEEVHVQPGSSETLSVSIPRSVGIQRVLNELILDAECLKQAHPLLIEYQIKPSVSEESLSSGERVTHEVTACDRMPFCGCLSFTFSYSAKVEVKQLVEQASIKAESSALFGVVTRSDTTIKISGENIVVQELFSVLHTPWFIPASSVLKEGVAAHEEMLGKLQTKFKHT